MKNENPETEKKPIKPIPEKPNKKFKNSFQMKNKNSNTSKANDLVNTILLSMFFMKSLPIKTETPAIK